MKNPIAIKINPAKYLPDIIKIASKTTGLLALILFTGIFYPESISAQKSASALSQDKKTYKVTFIELGSVRCIPCKQMQPVMRSIEKKYTNQVNVIFYDVWTAAGKPFGDQYHINAIPTQVFLDKTGKEFYRHEGFFPENELVKILKQKGVR